MPPRVLIPIATDDPLRPSSTVFIAPEDLLRSMYVVGKTGTGKSALLLRLFLGAAHAGFGLALIDPHGDLAGEALSHLPGRDWNRTVVFRPADASRPVGLNLLRPGREIPKSLVASSVVEVFRTLWGTDLFGPRSEHLLRNALLLLLESTAPSLIGLVRVITDADERRKLLVRSKDPLVRTFWLKEFPALGKGFAAEVTAPVLNKLGALSNPSVRRVVGQVSPRLDLRDAMDRGSIIVADLSGIGRDAARLLGALLVSGLEIAAHGRGDTPTAERRPFLLIGDEFQTYTTLSFLHLLSEGRKFGLCAALAHQHAAQLSDEVRSAVLGNAGTLVAFALGAEDADLIVKEFSPEFDAYDLRRLRRYRIIMRLLVGGESTYPMITKTFPPPPRVSTPRTLLRISAERYGRPADLVEREVSEAMGA
jgi:hypothetical protein